PEGQAEEIQDRLDEGVAGAEDDGGDDDRDGLRVAPGETRHQVDGDGQGDRVAGQPQEVSHHPIVPPARTGTMRHRSPPSAEGSMTHLPPFADLTTDARPAPRSPFDHALRALLDDLFAALPTLAHSIGYHAHDDRWPDLSEAGTQARRAMYEHHTAALTDLPNALLDADEAIDRGIVLEALDGLRFQAEVLRDEAWDPLT